MLAALSLVVVAGVAADFPQISVPSSNDIVKNATDRGKNPQPPAKSASSTEAKTVRDAWLALDSTKNDCTERELHFDYWPSGGVRNFYCHARSVFPWRALLTLSPHKPFLRGPHGNGGDRLDFDSKHDFGRYNPKFVRWLVDTAIPAASDATFRDETQPLYDKYVKELARAYQAVWQKMKRDPKWVERERKLYLKTMDEQEPDWSAFYIKYSTFLGDADSNWGGHDPNLQSAAVAFWLRRKTDGTAEIFVEGLAKLIKTYDAK